MCEIDPGKRIHGWRSAKPLPAVSLAASMLLIAIACDDKRDLPPNLPTEPPASQPGQSTVPPRPTTLQLLEAPRRHLNLTGDRMGLTIDVPPSWHLNTIGTSTYLEGETPRGDVRIQIIMKGIPLKDDTIRAMERIARQHATTQPEEYAFTPLRDIGANAKVLQQRDFLRHIPVTRDKGVREYVDLVDWTIEVFVPSELGYRVIALGFSGLTLDQYQKDREFLEDIIRTLHYDASGGLLDPGLPLK